MTRYTIAARTLPRWFFLFGLTALALTVRLLFILWVSVKPIAGGDPAVYREMAQHWVNEGLLYSQEGLAFRSPLYPLFLGVVRFIAGNGDMSVYLAQALLGAATVVLVWSLGKRITPAVATTAALVCAVYPQMLFFTKQILTENLATFLLMLNITLALAALDGRRWRVMVLGIGLGAAALARSETLILVGLVALGLFWFGKQSLPERVLRIGLMAACVLLILTPWMWRNAVVLGAPTLATEGGWTFYLGNNPQATGGYFVPPNLPPAPSDELARNSFYYRQGLDFAISQPLAALQLLPLKLGHLMAANNNLVLDASDVLLLPFTMIGLWVAVRARDAHRIYYFWACPLVSVILVSLIFIGQARFRAPVYPLLILFAAVGFVHALAWARYRMSGKLVAAR